MRLVSIQCPHCQRNLNVEEKRRGSRLRCPYPDCRRLFRWNEDGTCVAEREPPRVTSASQPVVYYDWRTQPPPRRLIASSQVETVEVPISTGSAEAEEVSWEELEALGFTRARMRSHSYAGLWTGLFFLTLLGMTALVGWLAFRAEQSREIHLASEAEKLFNAGQFSQALAKYRDLLRQFPGSARRGEYLFYEQACLLRALLSNPRADLHRLTQLATQFLRDYRSGPHFARHRQDLAEVLYQVARRALEDAKPNLDRLLLEQVQEIFAALSEIGFGLGDPAVRKNELRQAIQQTDYAIRLAEARNRLHLAIQGAFHLQRPTSVAQAQELFAQLRRDFPELGKDGEILKQLDQLAGLESSWLVHIALGPWQTMLDWAFAGEGVPSLPVLALTYSRFPRLDNVWQVERAPAATRPTANTEKAPSETAPRQLATVLCEGTQLVALQGTTGQTLWTARLPGAETLRVFHRETGRPRIYVWASQHRYLSAFDIGQARVLWTVHLPGDGHVVPAVCPPYWWLVEPAGGVWYGDTESGLVLGSFWLDHPLAAEVGTHPLQRWASVAARQKRVFLLDPDRGQARVLRSEHEAGALAASPLFISSNLLLPLVQDDQLHLWGLSLSASGGARPAAVRQLLRWPGRQFLQILSTGETAALLSDRGEIVLVQAGAGDQQPVQVLGNGKWTVMLPTSVEKTRMPAMRIFSERLGAWWLVSPGVVLGLHWDGYREQLRQKSYGLAPGEILDGAWDPLHPGRLVLLLREPNGLLRALAWDITQVSVAWNRSVLLTPTQAGDKSLGKP